MANQDDDVGYCKSPRGTQFQKGQSGNPGGRPKGATDPRAALRKALSEKVVINENGERKTVTKLEAAAKQMANQAVKGDPRAANKVLDPKFTGEDRAASSEEPAELGASDKEVVAALIERIRQALVNEAKASKGDSDEQRQS